VTNDATLSGSPFVADGATVSFAPAVKRRASRKMSDGRKKLEVLYWLW
jgi:hypothetical protein